MREQNSDILAGFFRAARHDSRLTATHMSLYFALYKQWQKNYCINPFAVTRRSLMRLAKISVVTYHKRMSELASYGYISYLPSYHPAIGSLVYLHYINQL